GACYPPAAGGVGSFFFFQAEDGIRDRNVTGVQTCALPISTVNAAVQRVPARDQVAAQALSVVPGNVVPMDSVVAWLEHNGYTRRSEERRVGKAGRAGWGERR